MFDHKKVWCVANAMTDATLIMKVKACQVTYGGTARQSVRNQMAVVPTKNLKLPGIEAVASLTNVISGLALDSA